MSARALRGVRGRLVLGFAVGVGVLLLLGRRVFFITNAGDYNVAHPVAGDNAAPGIEALLHGNVAGYLSHQPIIGLTTILLRLPFAALASGAGGGIRIYQLGALACVLPLAFAAGWLVSAREITPGQRVLRLVAAVLVIESPILFQTLVLGHPEDVVAAVLACGAVVAASRGHLRWAAVLLGLAIGAKEWAVIAVPSVMIAAPGRRREVTLIVVGLVALLCGLVWVADPPALVRALHSEGATRLISPLNVLWPLGSPMHLQDGRPLLPRLLPLGLGRTAGTLLAGAVAAPGLIAWWVHARRRGASCDPLALLALFGVLRCVCDSGLQEYYWVAALIPIAAWEAVHNRLPLLTALTSLGVMLLSNALWHRPPMELYVGALAGGVALIVFFARRAAVVAPRAPSPFRMPLASAESATASLSH
jgi:hypothetical protein